MDIHSAVPFIKPTHALPVVPEEETMDKSPTDLQGEIPAVRKTAAEEKEERAAKKDNIKRGETLVGSTSTADSKEKRGTPLPIHPRK